MEYIKPYHIILSLRCASGFVFWVLAIEGRVAVVSTNHVHKCHPSL
ncbi:hypothetical protein Hdeb2414_s0005g00172161 [Helianthus debilis subsp. tardiflorus]